MGLERRLGRAGLAKARPYTGYIEPVPAGETITWGSWRDKRDANHTLPITLFPYASGSDYSGGVVEQSNHRVLVDNAHVMRRSVLVEGGHGTFGIAYLGAPTRPIRRICDALDTYPLLDEDDHSELETEIEGKEWDSWGRADFKREIEIEFDLDLDTLGTVIGPKEFDRLLDLTWWGFAESHGDCGRKFEAPDSCHFYIDEAIEWLRAERDFSFALALGPVQWAERGVFSVARDAALEGREHECREILKPFTDIVLVEYASDEESEES